MIAKLPLAEGGAAPATVPTWACSPRSQIHAAASPRALRKPVVEVRRSPRRRRTVSAYRDGERVVVLIPAQFSGAEEREWVDKMVARLAARERRGHTDEALYERAQRLAERYLAEHPRRGRAGQRALGAQPERPLGLVHPGRPQHPHLRPDPGASPTG